ncbi:hypothetical protein JTB14_022336 [Gonioctena quinquepunctata]|nr:hypothetical protein JTB14_022336 [Gonioctena quinquepunctata]
MVTPEEIKIFFGMHALMGCIKFPRLHMYRSIKFECSMITNAMTSDSFYLLRVHFHVVNSLDFTEKQRKKNKLWKVQPMIDFVRNRCRAITRRENSCFSIDEHVIPFTVRCSVRQYVKNKPRPVGLKNFVMTTSDGIVLDFEIYQGETTPFPNKTLGLGPAVVLRVVETLPKRSSVFFYRYFTTLPLLDTLSESGLDGTGTLNPNRFKGQKITPDKFPKRGGCEEVSRSDKKICVTKWKDNKAVLMASTAFGVEQSFRCRYGMES